MTTPTWVDPQTGHNPTSGQSIPASWGDQVRDDLVFSRTGPGAKATRSGTQSVSTATFTAITWTSTLRDTDAFWSSGSATRLTSKFTGWYSLMGWAGFTSAAGSGKHIVQIRLNGTTYYAGNTYDGTLGPQMTATDLIYMTASSDYAELMVYQDSGGSMSVASGATFAMTWAGA